MSIRTVLPSRTTWYFLAPSLTVSMLMMVVGLGGAWYVHRVNRQVSDSLDAYLFSAQAAERLVFAIRDLRLDLDRFADTGDATNLDAADLSLRSIRTSLREVGTPTNLEAPLGEYTAQVAEIRHEADPAQARRIASGLVKRIRPDWLDSAERTMAERQRIARDTSGRNRVTAERIGIGLLLLGSCGSLAGMLAGYGIARSLNRTLVELSVPVKNMAGTLNAVVGPITVASNTDLTQLDESLRNLANKTAEVVGQLQESQRQSLRNEQLAAVGQWGAGLAHELRNPLMSMKLIVQTAAESADRSPVATDRLHPSSLVAEPLARLSSRDLNVLDEEITRLESMLQTFLDFARPPSPAKEVIDLLDVLRRTIDVVQLRAAQQDVTIHAPQSDSPCLIFADASQMRQVLLNLLLNSLDELPRGGNIWLTVVPQDGAVTFRIRDDGPGLSAEVAERIFEPFVSTKVTGIGLGLSTCRRIVESHDGEISARNHARGGAEFSMTLRQAAPPATAPPW